jgi:hypothetical protein
MTERYIRSICAPTDPTTPIRASDYRRHRSHWHRPRRSERARIRSRPTRSISLRRATATAATCSPRPSSNKMPRLPTTSLGCVSAHLRAAPNEFGCGTLRDLRRHRGVGKSTQILHAARALRGHGIDPIVTREPGGTPLAERIRALVLERRDEALPPRRRTAADVRRESRAPRESDRARVAGRALGALRPLHRRDLCLPGRGPRGEHVRHRAARAARARGTAPRSDDPARCTRRRRARARQATRGARRTRSIRGRTPGIFRIDPQRLSRPGGHGRHAHRRRRRLAVGARSDQGGARGHRQRKRGLAQ